MSGETASRLVLALAVAVLLGMLAFGLVRRRRVRRLWPWLLAAPVAAYAVALLAVFIGPP